MKTIEQLSEMTVTELTKVRDTLCRRYCVGQRGNVLEIAFGVAEKANKIDPQRRDAICIYVSSKRMPRAKKDRIPKLETVRIRRGGRYVRVCLATDVILVKRLRIRLTGRTVRHLERRETATAGCIVAWRIGGLVGNEFIGKGPADTKKADRSEAFHWGVMTVGHLFSSVKSVPESTPSVRVLIPESSAHPQEREIAGTLLARTRKGDGSRTDAALIQVQRSHLVSGDVLGRRDASVQAQQVRSVESLKTDQLRNGLTLPGDTPIAFTVKRFYPVFNLISAVGPLDHVLDVESTHANTFAPGHSGTLWVISQQGSCLQFAGWEVARQDAMSYRIGSGQSLEKILHWACGAIASAEGVSRSSVDLRLVRQL